MTQKIFQKLFKSATYPECEAKFDPTDRSVYTFSFANKDVKGLHLEQKILCSSIEASFIIWQEISQCSSIHFSNFFDDSLGKTDAFFSFVHMHMHVCAAGTHACNVVHVRSVHMSVVCVL
mmetsp:Transcript_19254/g.36229  ORF Transcript_19254/g.36229 Transcript_19254/m.36229 type:complete len:120 (-) Transcript_19254:327-686(-)